LVTALVGNMEFVTQVTEMLGEAYAIKDNIYPLGSNIFSVHRSNSLQHHLAIAFTWYMICWPIMGFSFIVCRLIAPDWSLKEQFERAACVPKMAHHIMAAYMGLRTIFFNCRGVGNFMFMGEFCFRDYHPEYSLSGMISVGYFCFETTVLCIVLRDFSGRALQKIAHHVAGFIAVSTALVCGLNFPLLSQVARCSELSGIFIIIHEQKTKHTKGFADKLNRIIIFATYTFTRIFMFPIIWVHIVYIGYISFNYSRLSWRICYIALTVMATGLVYLNFFWYQFLLRGIKGVCAGVGKKETAKDS